MNKRDITAIGIVVLFSVLGFVFFGLKGNGDTVKISAGGKTYGNYLLNTDKKIKIKAENGFNIVEIKDGKVFMKDADCKDKLCVKQGKIDSGSIVCLPHKVVVEIVSGKNEIDAVAK